jgi:hypothetical protein
MDRKVRGVCVLCGARDVSDCVTCDVCNERRNEARRKRTAERAQRNARHRARENAFLDYIESGKARTMPQPVPIIDDDDEGPRGSVAARDLAGDL